MADELKILLQEAQEPDMPERRATEIMLALIRELQASVSRTEGAVARMSEKLDRITDERREEARENGEISARVKSLEKFREQQEERRRGDRMVAVGAFITALGAMLMMFVKMVLKNPDVVK